MGCGAKPSVNSSSSLRSAFTFALMVLRGGGATWSQMTFLFRLIASLFSHPKFPVRLLRETRLKRSVYRDN